MRIFGLAGWSGSGKTTLMTCLLPEFAARGLRVSTLKHAHESFEIDQPGKDSYAHREAGAQEVVIASAHRFALIHELRGAPEPSLDELVARMSPVDLVLVEGWKGHPHPKIEIYRPSLGKPLLHPGDPYVVALASDEPVTGLALPWLPLGDPQRIARFILDTLGLPRWPS